MNPGVLIPVSIKGDNMKIYRYWATAKIDEAGGVYHFKDGSNESEEAARQKVQQKIYSFRKYRTGERQASIHSEDYEVPICEELVHAIDKHNLITRNRYGALVLNSDDLLFLDIDDAPCSFFDWLGSLFGPKKTKKEKILRNISKIINQPEFRNIGLRIYETCRGIRLLFALPAQKCIESGKIKDLARLFSADELYTQLCLKQHCCRARLTPKPARIHMKTMLKFKFPYADENQPDINKWLNEYQTKSEKYNVCHLLLQNGPEITGTAVEYHDQMTGAGQNLPLA